VKRTGETEEIFQFGISDYDLAINTRDRILFGRNSSSFSTACGRFFLRAQTEVILGVIIHRTGQKENTAFFTSSSQNFSTLPPR